MAGVDLTPLQLYLRYYSAEKDTNLFAGANEVQISALKALPSTDLDALIAFVAAVLAKGDESIIRSLFLDGHHYYKWERSTAASDYLRNLLQGAKFVKNAAAIG
jgi:hypothetical protein